MIHAALVLAQYRATVTVGDRTELRARFTQTSTAGRGSSSGPIFDLSTTPVFAVSLDNRRFAHSLSYAPRLTLRGDAVPGANPDVLHAGTLRSSWRARHVSIALSESASYGARNFGDLLLPQTTTGPTVGVQVGAPTRPIALQLLPTTRSINYGSTQTTLGSVVTPARRWSLATSATFQMSGGTDADARAFLPVQRSGIFDATLSYALSRSDRLLTTVTPSVTAIPEAICEIQPLPTVPPSLPVTCNRAMQVVDLGEGWSKRWTRHTTTSFLGGVSARRTRVDVGAPFRTTVAPLATAELTHQAGRILFAGTSRVGTVVDQRTGLPETRMSHGVTADWRHFRDALHGSVQYSQSVGVSAVRTVRVLYGEASLTHRLSSRLDALTGVRLTLQENQGTSTFLTNLFVGVIYHEPRILF